VGRAWEKEERGRERVAGWAGLQKEKKERGEEMAGWAGPKGEKREGKERGKTKQMPLSLRMKLEFKFKSK
jgi:hypothetical protein